MKKLCLILIVSILLLTGCSKEEEKDEKLLCYSEIKINEENINISITVNIEKGKVKSLSSVMGYKDANEMNKYCEMYKSSNNLIKEEKNKLEIECINNNVVVKNYDKMLSKTDRERIINKKEEDLLKYMKEKEFTCKIIDMEK